MHGLTKIIQSNRSSKIIWAILVICSFASAVFLTQELWTEFLSNKVRVEQSEVRLGKMEFPTLTLCDFILHARTQVNLTVVPLPKVIPGTHLNPCGSSLECLQGSSYGLTRREANHLIHFKSEIGNHCLQVKGHTTYVPGEVLFVIIARNQTKNVHWTALYVHSSTESFFEADTSIDWLTEGLYKFKLTKKSHQEVTTSLFELCGKRI